MATHHNIEELAAVLESSLGQASTRKATHYTVNLSFSWRKDSLCPRSASPARSG